MGYRNMIEIKYKDETLYFKSLEAVKAYAEKLKQEERTLNETIKQSLTKTAMIEEKIDILGQHMIKRIIEKNQCSEEKANEILVEWFKKEHGSVPSKFLNPCYKTK